MNEKHEIPGMMEESDKGIGTADLRATRKALGLSLQDIFAATRVSLSNLQAVENEDFDRLPPPVYARNFIRKYARAVGIAEEPLLTRYEGHLKTKKPPQIDEEVRRPWPENGRRWRFLVLSLAVVILAGSLVYALFLYDQAAPPPGPSAPPVESTPPDAKPAAEPEIKAVPTTPVPTTPVPTTPAPTTPVTTTPVTTTTPPAPPAPSAVGEPPAAAATGMHQLVLAARELTWIRIRQDRNAPQEILLKPGERIERTAADHFLLDIGNAGGLRLTFQGKDLGSLGKSGQVLRLRLPEQTAGERKTTE